MEDFIAKAIEFMSNQQVLLIGGIVAELVMRFVKTEKPMSIIRIFASGARSVGSVCVAIADFSDKIFPQNTK